MWGQSRSTVCWDIQMTIVATWIRFQFYRTTVLQPRTQRCRVTVDHRRYSRLTRFSNWILSLDKKLPTFRVGGRLDVRKIGWRSVGWTLLWPWTWSSRRSRQVLTPLIFVCRTQGKFCFGSSSETYLVAVLAEDQVVNRISFQMVSSLSRKQG